MKKLTEVSKKTHCKVVSIDCNDAKLKQRLKDLGFVPGTTVYVKRRAPLGSPIEYELRGTKICLRQSESEMINVEMIEAPDE